MSLNKKSITIATSCYLIWGIVPAYWNLLSGLNPLLILCGRIVFSLAFVVVVLAISSHMNVFKETLKNKAKMRFLVPASVLITLNWGIFIWAVNSGRILETSLGYYMNPLTGFLLGVILFKEKYSRLQLLAVALAFTGVLISLIAYGSFPLVALSLTISFAMYGVLKKKAQADPMSSIAVESLLVTPVALIFAFAFLTDDVMAVTMIDLLLLIGGGIATAIPLALFARAVNEIPFIIISFLQYISPSMTLIYGLINGETITESRLISFIFIGLGLIVFSTALVRQSKKQQAELKAAE